MDIKLSIIIVNYNTQDLLINCLKSVYEKLDNLSFEIIVVDNNSKDDSVSIVRKEFPSVTMIANKENAGFAKGNNIGMKLAKGDIFLLLNTDTLLLDNHFAELITLFKDPKVGIVGPKVLNADHTLQISFNRFPGIFDEFERMLKIAMFLQKRRYVKRVKKNPAPFPVDWVSGCCFFIHRKVIDKIGGMDEMFFLYNEEVDLCLRAKKEGWQTFFYPDSSIIHLGGESSKKNIYRVVFHRYKSRLLFAKKHYHFFKYCLYFIIVIIALLTRMVLIKFSKSKEGNERYRAYVNALRLHFGLQESLSV